MSVAFRTIFETLPIGCVVDRDLQRLLSNLQRVQSKLLLEWVYVVDVFRVVNSPQRVGVVK